MVEGGAVGFFYFQFQFELALTQIDVFRLRIDLKIHGGDTRGERMNGHLASTDDAKIGRWDLEQIQHGRHHGFGTRYDGSRTHDDDVVACNPKEGMRSTSRPQSLLTTSSATSRRSSTSGLSSSTFFSGERPPSPCRESWGLRPTTILPTETSDEPSESRWDPFYPKRSLTARFAAPLARSMAELAFRFTPRLAPRTAPLFTPRMPAKRLGSPNGPPLFNDFQPSRLASDLAADVTSLKTLPRNDPMPPPP